MGHVPHGYMFARSPWRRSRSRAAAVSRTLRNHSSTCRPGSIPIPTRCRSWHQTYLPGLPEPDRARQARRRGGARLRRAIAGSCGRGAGHADPAAAGRGAGAARARGRAGTDLRRDMPRRRARRARCRRRSPTLRRSRHADLAIVVNPNNPDGRIVAARRSARYRRRAALRAAACWWWTKRSWTLVPPDAEPCAATSRAATSSCCDRSASSSGLPDCGSALRWRRRRSRRGCARCSGHGRFRDRRLRSARSRSPTPPGCGRCGRGSIRRRDGSTSF